MKKILSIVLVGVILTGLFNSIVFGKEYIGLDSGWRVNDDGIITGCYAKKVVTEENGRYKVIVPYSIAGIKVVGLDDEWIELEYEQMKNMDIYIPSSITSMAGGSLHHGPVTYMSEYPVYYIEKGSYADKFISEKNKKASRIGDAYRIKYVDSVEKIEVEDKSITENIEYEKEMKILPQKEISAVDTDLKEAFKKKIAEHPKSEYFLFDIDNDNIPELYIVNVEDSTTTKNKGEASKKSVSYERYGYYYSKSEDITPKLGSIESTYFHSVVGGFYVWNCNGTDRLIEKLVSTDEESYSLEVVNKYYSSPLMRMYNSTYSNGRKETNYQYIGENDLKKYLNGEKLEYGIPYTDKYFENENKEKEYEKKILDYAKSIENNPVKTYSTNDLTGIENWDFSNIKIIESKSDDNSMASNDISVILNDKKLEFSQSPVIENGTTLVPMRAIFEAMGAEVNWDGETKTVTSSKDNTSIKLTVDSNSAEVNGSNVSLAVPAKIVNGSTMVPLRFVSESLGAEVSWDGETKTVSIKG